MAKAAQMSGIGIASTPLAGAAAGAGVTDVAGALVMTDGDGDFGAGTVSSGCVFVIFTPAGAAAGWGRMLMRAVSFFGPGCGDPG